MRGPGGYGRYNDDPEYVGCPRAQSDMTPCIARDGALALASSPDVCVGCGQPPGRLLRDLVFETGRGRPLASAPAGVADELRDLVREVTSPPR